jgi:hypothetical protein
MNAVQEKVFGIGMFKTGLTSLGQALERLGYRFSADQWYHGKIEDDPWALYPQFPNDQLRLVTERADAHDAHVDYPWMFLFREMDRAFAGARFIYTVRDPERLATSNQNDRAERHTGGIAVPRADHSALLGAPGNGSGLLRGQEQSFGGQLGSRCWLEGTLLVSEEGSA